MKIKILILGGTMFAGRALVEKLLLNKNYDITLFNRGKSNKTLFPDVLKINGSRETEDILQICNKYWDVVIDFSGYYPKTFEQLLVKLSGNVGRYIFISTISVFQIGNSADEIIYENDETLHCSEEQMISALPDAYGEKKAAMARILLSHIEMDSIILRPSFIYGRYDWTDRFYYWLYRAKHAEQILMPEATLLSLTYVEDLVSGLLKAIEIKEHKPIYNAITHSGISLKETIDVVSEILNKNTETVVLHENIMKEKQLDNNSFPLSLPFNLRIEGNNWLNDFSLTPTSFRDSISQTISYCDSIGWPLPKAGMSINDEKALLLSIS